MSEDALPPAVRAALSARGAAEVRGAMRSEREVPLPSLVHGSPRSAPLWLVHTDGQLWLVAADDDPPTPGLARAVAVATGAPEEARIDRSFGTVAVSVAETRARLPRSEVSTAEALLEAFSREAGGPAHPFEATFANARSSSGPKPARGRWAPGCRPGPDGWLEAAGGAEDDRWLLVSELATEVQLAGMVRDRSRPLALGVSARRITVAVLGEAEAASVDISPPVHVASVLGDRLEGPRLRLGGKSFQGVQLARAAELAAAPHERRYAIAARHRLEDDQPDDALALLELSLASGFEGEAAGLLSAFALARGDGALAAGLLARSLSATAEPGDADTLGAWAKRAREASGEKVEAVLEQARTEAHPPIPLAPWPPNGPSEVWAVAAIEPLGPALALDALDAGGGGARRLQWRAALTADAVDLRAAAHALRHDGQAELARVCLEAAQAARARVDEAWRLVAWSLSDHADPSGPLARAFELDGEGKEASRHLDAPALLEAAERAANLDLPSAPTLFAIADGHQVSSPVEDRVRRAERLRDDYGAPLLAAPVFRRAAEQLSDDADPETAPALRAGALWLEAARCYAAGGDPASAGAAVRAAAETDFLHAGTLRSSAELEGAAVSEEARRRWRHVAEVLSPTGAPVAGARPEEKLSPAFVASLRPGEGGWLDELRAKITTPELPPRDQLVRGLERVEGPARHEALFACVEEVSLALGLDPVPTYVYRGDDAIGLSGWPVSPPVLLVGHEHLPGGSRPLDPAALRFAVAVELTHIAAGHPVLAIDDSLLGTSKSVYQAFGKFAGKAETVVDLVTLIPGIDQLAKLEKILKLSRRFFGARTAVDKARGLAQPLLDKWLPGSGAERKESIGHDAVSQTALQLRLQADRAALALGGDLGAAVRALLLTSGPNALARTQTLSAEGVSALLEGDGESRKLSVGEGLRIAALVEEAVRGPQNATVLRSDSPEETILGWRRARYCRRGVSGIPVSPARSGGGSFAL